MQKEDYPVEMSSVDGWLSDDDEILAADEYGDDDDADVEYDEMWASDDDDSDEDLEEYADDDDDDRDEFLGPLMTGLMPPLIGGLGKKLLGTSSRSRRSRKYRRYTRLPVGRGIAGMTLRTPRGNARLRLPQPVVPMDTYKRDMARLQSRDNGLTNRINQTQRDLSKTDKKAVRALAVATQANAGVASLKKVHRRDVIRMRRVLKKIKDAQASQATMSMLMGMMQVQGVQGGLEQHVHADHSPATNIPQQNNMMMMLPLLMSEGGDNDDMLMMMLMMQAFNK